MFSRSATGATRRPSWPTGARDTGRAVRIVTTLVGSTGAGAAGALLRRTKVRAGANRGLVHGFERLGPTFVKAGQLIASSPRAFPPDLAEACRRCLDAAPHVPADVIRRTIEADLGAPITELFADFDDDPLSAASTAQVHACTLPDGRAAVVKVQRPGIATTMHSDLRLFARVARIASHRRRFATANPMAIVEDLRAVTIGELDPRHEAVRHRQIRNQLNAFGDNGRVTAPELYESHCGDLTICMERMNGTPIDQLDVPTSSEHVELLKALVKEWIEAACLHGPFHGDVHAGNIWVLDDGRICFLDFGITGQLEPAWRKLIANFLLTVGGVSDWQTVGACFKDVGAIPMDAGSDQSVGEVLAALVGPFVGGDRADASFAEALGTALKIFETLGSVVPAELVLVLKQLLYFERYAEKIAPGWVLATDPALTVNVRPRFDH